MLKLIVDFNAVRDGLVRGLIEDASGQGEIAKGQLVLLDDDEGTHRIGLVSHVDDGLVFASVLKNRPQLKNIKWTIPQRAYRPRPGQPPALGSLPRVKGVERELELA